MVMEVSSRFKVETWDVTQARQINVSGLACYGITSFDSIKLVPVL